MFKKKKLQKLTDMANKINESVSDAIHEIVAYAKEINPDIVDSEIVRHMVTMLTWRNVEDPIRLSTTIDFDERMESIAETKADFKKELDIYGKKVNENKGKLNNFYKNGMPLFLKFTSLYRNTVMYAMCYEIKQYEDGSYKAYIFSDGEGKGKVIEFCYWDYSIEPMTETEFEQFYIIGRMGVSTHYCEEDAIEYDNYLRRLFHGQREIID
jgi:hypothetical protein